VSSRPFTLNSSSSSSIWGSADAIRLVCTAVDSLPPVPPHLLELQGQLLSVPVDLDRVSQLVMRDALLEWHLLRACNLDETDASAMSVEHAVLLLGSERLRSLAFACALLMPGSRNIDSAQFGVVAHGALRAMVAQYIACDGGYEDCEIAYIAALLQDIGKQVPQARLATINSDPRFSGELGAWMAALWNLPQKLVELIRWHPSPSGSGGQLVDILSAAEDIVQTCTGAPGDTAETYSPAALETAMQIHLRKDSHECRAIAHSIWMKFAGLLATMAERA
jgi:HD-like signal output (HDOD) protein